MQDINQEDIESMEVLKDARSKRYLWCASKHSGVILSTTKTGKKDVAKSTSKPKWGLSYVNNPYDFLGAKIISTYCVQAIVNPDLQPQTEVCLYCPLGNLTSASPFGTGNTLNDKTIWNIMNKTADNAYLLQKGWQRMPGSSGSQQNNFI
ncbi:hypothetical protein NXW59_00140 [Bacteroides fragilis]|nr:hypothetical protein [Bacteroides fragilis]